MDIYRFFLDRLVFPRIIELSTPGIIESRVAGRLGGVRGRTRIISVFESVVARVEVDAFSHMGREATDRLMYRAGKRFGARYVLFQGKKVPQRILPNVVEFFFNACRAAGFRVAENISYDPASKLILLHGRDNIICRLTGGGAIFAGFTAGAMSVMLGEEMEAIKPRCTGRGDDACEVVCFPRGDARTRLRADVDPSVGPHKSYIEDNFGARALQGEGLPCFSDLTSKET